jgi:N-acetylmuramoyl-L-alanine amidase
MVRTWPVPIPQWFWAWARWYLGRGEFADDRPQDADVRPSAAPRYVPEWAWQRLRVLEGGDPTPLPARTLEPGDEGPAIAAMQRALNGARYVAGPADGAFGAKTRYAVIAFEQANDLEPDGVVHPDEWLRMLRERRPAPPLASPGGYVYVDLDRQILFDVYRGRVIRVLPISTGGGYTYTGLDGAQHVAVTPRGRFEVFRKVAGKDTSYLGNLYYPSYFTNGYAIHGSKSVPPTPVSHGCVRIPLWLSQEFFDRVRIGTPVIVE